MKALKYKILNFLFVITLGKFFLQWLLPTNSRSFNPLWRNFCYILRLDYSTKLRSVKTRAKGAVMLFIGHLFLMIIFFIIDDMKITFGNALVNLYPMWVQVYVGLRCYWIIKKREASSVKYEAIPSKGLILEVVT